MAITQFGVGGAMWVMPNNSITGFRCVPLSIPADLDVSRPIDLFCFVAPNGDLASSAIAALRVRIAAAHLDGTHTNTLIFAYPYLPIQSAPLPTQRFHLAVDPDPSFAGGAFAPTDLVGLELARLGSDIEDTLTLGLRVALVLELRYFIRCTHVCCP